MLAAVQTQTPGDGDTVADSNADTLSPSAAVPESGSGQFPPDLTTKILELLCDESVC